LEGQSEPSQQRRTAPGGKASHQHHASYKGGKYFAGVSAGYDVAPQKGGSYGGPPPAYGGHASSWKGGGSGGWDPPYGKGHDPYTYDGY
jgi:hypothetical protein